MAEVVNMRRVGAWTPTSPRTVQKLAQVLTRQGQIEPLQVYWDKFDGKFMPFLEDPWGSEIVVAAETLGWHTILVVVMERYEA